MDIQRIQAVLSWMDTLGKRSDWAIIPISRMEITRIRNMIIRISQDIASEYYYFSNELFRLKDILFLTSGTVNPPIFGQVYAILRALQNYNQHSENDLWKHIHPLIIKSSKRLFLNGHYANAAEDAFIEINDRVKKLYKKLQPQDTEIPDGVDVMNKMFSDKNPMMEICDRNSDTGINIHRGTRFMLVGAMAALRNPKAHSNDEELSPEEAMRRLMFASMLMYKIDGAILHSRVSE